MNKMANHVLNELADVYCLMSKEAKRLAESAYNAYLDIRCGHDSYSYVIRLWNYSYDTHSTTIHTETITI